MDTRDGAGQDQTGMSNVLATQDNDILVTQHSGSTIAGQIPGSSGVASTSGTGTNDSDVHMNFAHDQLGAAPIPAVGDMNVFSLPEESAVYPYPYPAMSMGAAFPMNPRLLGSMPDPPLLHSRRMQWMPDFTFGPASELIDIKEFLKAVEDALDPQITTGDVARSDRPQGQKTRVRPEDVAGWDELQALEVQDRSRLEEECSVLDLVASLTDITSDPARLNLVKDIHNKSTLAALGHTVESIKLPPEKRDRKRKTDGKVGGLGDRNGNGRGEANKPAQADGSKSAQERVGCEVRRQGSEATGGQQGVYPLAMLSESMSEAGPTVDPANQTEGSSRKGKSQARAGETNSDPVILELGRTLGGLKLQSWQLDDTAKHYIRKPRSSDVNVLTEVRPSVIPFTLSEDSRTRSQPPTPNNASLQGVAVHELSHALIELSILTPAPHPPHTPRHTLSLALLNTQTLEDISEALVCFNRWVPRSISDSAVPSGACIVVEGTVYGDGEGDVDGKDYANKVTEYLAALKAQATAPTGLGKKERDAIMILDEQLKIGLPMLGTRLDSVRWKLHKPYWFMHDGGCVHWVVVSSISLLHPHDPPLPTPEKASNWPYTTSLSPLPHRALCRICARVPAVSAVSGDVRLGESPSLVCDGCWGLLGPSKAGRDYLEAGGLTILPLVSPDGL